MRLTASVALGEGPAKLLVSNWILLRSLIPVVLITTMHFNLFFLIHDGSMALREQ